MEASFAVGKQAGWLPLHIGLRDSQKKLIGALPLYLKNHSYGEYIFDWAWADASERAGLPYYPKLVSAIPFTPATGSRLLLEDSQNKEYAEQLWQGALAVQQATNASSIHLLFTPTEHRDTLSNIKLIPRSSLQFHWSNPNISSFEEWLSLFKTKTRKNVRAERRKAKNSVDRIFWLQGSELETKHIETIWSFYQHTSNRKWGQAYLPKAFFQKLNKELAHLTWICFAEKDSQLVAGSLCFQKDQHLYGRYWGCLDFFDSLHFELCYHQPIELCIQKGWQKFEAGAQGEHKLKRGLLARETHSLHWLHHSGLHNAIERYCAQEALETKKQLQYFLQHSPLKKS